MAAAGYRLRKNGPGFCRVGQAGEGKFRPSLGQVVKVRSRRYLVEAEERKDWDKRLTEISREVDDEPTRTLKSYEVQVDRVEPIGVVYLWPISG